MSNLRLLSEHSTSGVNNFSVTNVFTDDYENSHTGMVDIPAEAYELLPEVPEAIQVDEGTYDVWSSMDTESITNDFITQVESLLKEEE